MHVITKSFCGDMSIPVGTSQAWHTATVVGLMNSAKGDLMLDRFGNLTDRNIWGTDYQELPFDQHTPNNTMAMIGRDGWLLTKHGAQFILENCPPDRKADVRRLSIVAGV